MACFVLVHGAWHGGWVWRDVEPLLVAAGHRVLTPTLTGMGDRLHLLSAATGVVQHTEDILAHIAHMEAEDVVLVGHSYGARPTALACASPAVIRWVSLDGVAAIEGATLMDGAPAEVVAVTRAALVMAGLAVPPLPAEALGVPIAHPSHAWVSRRLTPLPFRCVEEPMPPLPARFATLPRAYVEAKGNRLAGPKAGLAQAKAEGWPVVAIDSGHDLPVTAPAEVAEVLLRLAAG
ncbi:alpha/beta fold hydrolase [Thermaurantiacus sp.]